MKTFGKISVMAYMLAAGHLLLAQAPSAQAPQRVSEGAGSTLFGNTCGTCHGKLDEAPPPAMLKKLTPEKIYEVITTGNMRTQAGNLTDLQKRDVAEWIGGRKLGATGGGEAKSMSNPCSSNPAMKDLTSAPAWNGWSPDMGNLRYQTAKSAGLSPAAVGRLRLKWAFGLPSAASSYGQPTIVDGRVFVSSDSGYFYALDAASGCVHWSFQAQSGIRSASTIGIAKPASPGVAPQYAAFFGDIRGNVYAVNVNNGELLWKIAIDPHPLSRVTGAIRYHNGRLYVPVASLEEPESSSVNYPCCTFRGMVAAIDAATGKQVWKTYTIDEKPTPRKTKTGQSFMGPSGGGVWGPPTVDPKRRAVYISTGNAFSEPDTGRSDAVMALSMDTGKILWVKQDQPGDVWHTGCFSGVAPPGFPPKNPGGRGGAPQQYGPRPGMPDSYYCPDTTTNPDWDFSAGTMLVNLPNGKSLVIAAQKAGVVWAHDPDRLGELVWKSDISRGQIVFGGAADDQQAYFGMRAGGIAAVQLSDGLEKWYTPWPPQASMETHPGLTAALSVIPGVVFAAGLDGMLRALAALDGRVLWQYDTTQEVKTVNGVTARGGSIGSAGPTIAQGMVFVTSGYTGFQGGHPGNLLLAFSAE